MHYSTFAPGHLLKDYVQCYYHCESDNDTLYEDNVFASGCIEILFNLGDDAPQKIINGNTQLQPAVQLWGQTIQPLTFTASGKHTMLGLRFFPHTAACFFEEPIAALNDQFINFNDLAGDAAVTLHAQLLEAPHLSARIALLENFLLSRLARSGRKPEKLPLLNNVIARLHAGDFLENITSVSAHYGMSSRYLQQLFFRYTGLSPNLFSKIARFQKSLEMVARQDLSLTDIAHRCAYYDQSHFIKDFKYFTGFKPSHFQAASSTDLLAILEK